MTSGMTAVTVRSVSLGYLVVWPKALTSIVSAARMSPFAPPLTVAVSFDVGRDITAVPLANHTHL